MDILRFITAGNVDDGKSTLIGRLLYDTHNIKTDVLQSVTGKSEDNAVNLAHITDGLRTEREQGITIDVAYKYFTTKNRKYIITDAPGHFQYTKNLVTGASSVDAIIILIDVKNGITAQTKRHSLVTSFLKIKHIIVAVNKMDLVDYSEDVYNNICNEFKLIAAQLHLPPITFIPISALSGDNVSILSTKMDWYNGTSLLEYLENCRPAIAQSDLSRFGVQCIIHSNNGENGYAGNIISGVFKVGDEITIHPQGYKAIIKKLIDGYNEVRIAKAGENATVYFTSDLMAVRGNIFTNAASPVCSHSFRARICWLNELEDLKLNTEYFLRILGQETRCIIKEVTSKTNIDTLEDYTDRDNVSVNQFADIVIETKDIIAFDMFDSVAETGRGIIIDVNTNYTSGAFIVTDRII